MPWQRDSLDTIVERVKNDIEITTGLDAHSQGSAYTHLAQVFGALCHGMYGMIEYYGKQIADADKDDDTLLAEAASLGINRIPAVYAGGNITVTGTPGATLLQGSQWQSSDGEFYAVDADLTLTDSIGTVAVTALAAGAAANQVTGTGLQLVSPVAGIANAATVSGGGITGGADQESIERVRARLRERKHNPPQGGSDYDYIRWARAAHSDVTRAWVYAHETGVGSVVLRFVTEGLADPIPTPAHVSAVRDYINRVDIRPAGLRNLTITAPLAVPLGLVFTSLTPNTTSVRNAIALELADWLKRQASPGCTLLLRQLEQALRAAGAEDFDINITANKAHSINQFPVVGAITWPT